LEPGASEVLTHGLRARPSALALRASRPAAITLRGLLVLVQLVMAAMMTAPSGILPGSFSTLPAMPWAASSDTGRRLCGLDGPAMLRTTLDRSKRSTRSYSAFQAVGPQAGLLGVGFHQLDLLVFAAGQRR
jgi:hypothetical protein